MTSTGMLDFDFPSNLEAPGQARRSTVEATSHLPQGLIESVQLLISELVTNAVNHPVVQPLGSIHLRLELGLSMVRVEVSDSGLGFDPLLASVQMPGRDSHHGRGVPIVDLVSDRWGVDRSSCNTVWFEMDFAGKS